MVGTGKQEHAAPVEGTWLVITWVWVKSDISENRYSCFCVKYSILNITRWVNWDLPRAQMQPRGCTIVALEEGDAANTLSMARDILRACGQGNHDDEVI